MGNQTLRDWNTLEQYLLIHDRQLSRFDHFILLNTLRFELTEHQIFVRGRLHCGCDTYLDVDETIIRRTDGLVRSVKYSYHAGVLFPARRDLFRYDNAHPHRGHSDEHHKHRFQFDSGSELKPPVWIGQAGRPFLDDVLSELETWCVERPLA